MTYEIIPIKTTFPKIKRTKWMVVCYLDGLLGLSGELPKVFNTKKEAKKFFMLKKLES